MKQRAQLYRGCQCYWWRKLEYMEITTDLPQATDTFYHIMLYRGHLFMSNLESERNNLKSEIILILNQK
jgi:putative alpha-1,2-mannosidase